MQKDGKTLNDTFIPKTILRKTEMKNTNPMVQKNSFEKTHGNNYVQLDPPQIKFNGYEINKVNTLNFKIVNKAPIPQRFNIIPPAQPHFSIKVNKKGNIPTGMHEIVQVSFKATDYKYLYDVVKINTETENFIVPLYAYPTIPNVNTIFPKLIDFGNIQLKQTQSFLYPIKNPTPIDYKFDFMYRKQCAEIMINPLSGIIPGSGQIIVQISFIPNRKMTYSAQVYFKMQQFDFDPINIQIIGSGKQKQMSKTFKRLGSSKLVPLKQKQIDQQKQRMNQTQTLLNDKTKDNKKLFQTNIRKINPRVSYPKLLNAAVKQKTLKAQETLVQTQLNQKSGSSIMKNSEERQFLNRFNKIQELDKQKQIKFTEYLGDRAMTEGQIDVQDQIVSQMKNFRSNLLKTQCQTRYNPESNDMAEIEYQILKNKQSTWDQNKNDLIYQRKSILNKLVIAASKIIEVRRIKQRFEKIKLFLSDCSTKQQVTKKVEISYQKSLDSHSQNALKDEIQFRFNRNSLQPTYFQLQFSQGKQKFNSRTFQPEGKPQFDDLTALTLIQPYQSEKMLYNQINLPSDFVQLSKIVPPQRVSGEQQFALKSSSLPKMQVIQLFDIVKRPFQIPNHYFIHQKQNMALFKEYKSKDQKDSQFIFSIDEPLQDQFQGWSRGEMEVLKTKLLKNTGIQYSSASAYNYSSYRNDIGFFGDFTQNLPQFIERPALDDQISDDDSDDQKYQQSKLQRVQQFLQKYQSNPEVKVRRQKKEVQDQQKKNRQKVDKNLQKDKLKKVTNYIEKVINFNKMAQQPENMFVL